ncbi:MAG: hypothetical protein EOO38_02230 [Cytophagaceae bacterium]|nr:MAG: hypothetical protein EOO38_02230 [Cytophagaceae bacterium]
MSETQHQTQQAAWNVLRNCVSRTEYIAECLSQSAGPTLQEIATHLMPDMGMLKMAVQTLEESERTT